MRFVELGEQEALRSGENPDESQARRYKYIDLLNAIMSDIMANGTNSWESRQLRGISYKYKILKTSPEEFVLALDEALDFVRTLKKRRESGAGESRSLKIF